MFGLLVLYYAYYVHKATWETKHRKRFMFAAVLFNAVYFILVVILTCLTCYDGIGTDSVLQKELVMLREILSGLIFSSLSLFLGEFVVLKW